MKEDSQQSAVPSAQPQESTAYQRERKKHLLLGQPQHAK